jgi:hypothetical protein
MKILAVIADIVDSRSIKNRLAFQRDLEKN